MNAICNTDVLELVDQDVDFTKAVESYLPTEEKKGKGKGKKGPKPEGKSAYQLKKERKAAEEAAAPVEVTAPVEVVKEVSPASNIDLLTDNTLVGLFGDDFVLELAKDEETLTQINALREEAKKMMEQAKSMSATNNDQIPGLRVQVWNMRHSVYFKAEKAKYNDMKAHYGALATWPKIHQALVDMEDAWHKNGNKELANKWQAILDSVIEASPNLCEDKLSDEEKASKMEARIQEMLDRQQKVFNDAQAKFDEANALAKANGFPTTEAKAKKSVGK